MKETKPKNGETVRILLALIQANIEVLQNFDFEKAGFNTSNLSKEEAKRFKEGYLQGGRDFLNRIRHQLGGG